MITKLLISWLTIKLISESLAVIPDDSPPLVADADFPASDLQVRNLAEGVCGFLFDDDENKWLKCIEDFSNSDNSVSQEGSPAQVGNQTELSVTVRMPKRHAKQLAILIPQKEDAAIYFEIFNEKQEISTIYVEFVIPHSLWTCTLYQDGTHSSWSKGQVISFVEEDRNNYSIMIEQPQFSQSRNDCTVDAVFTWEYTGSPPSIEIDVTNICNKLIVRKMKPPQRSITLTDLPPEMDCSFKIHGTQKYKITYKTPLRKTVGGCEVLPEIVQNVTLFATQADDSSWDVYVDWLRPDVEPDKYNVTLRADVVSSVILAGNATDYTFTNITGEGYYNVSIRALLGKRAAQTSRQAKFPDREADTQWRSVAALGALCAALALGASILGSAVWWRRRRNYLKGHLIVPSPVEDKFLKEPVAGPLSEDSWEVSPERLTLREVVGEGAFGVVRRGTLAPGREVAVKMLKDFPTLDEIRSFRTEMALMKTVGVHPHVVSLVGCCSGRRPLIIAEYCSRGDLLTFLRCSWDIMVSKRKYYNNNIESTDFRNDLKKLHTEQSKLVVNKLYDLHDICKAELTSLDLLSFCRQIAMGMKFLASNRVVHRDLAARNVLVSSDRTLKIADFGLSRDVYQENQYKQKGNCKMPVKWMALESLTHRIYTTQSDVWSFGVVIWEIVTVGGAPYSSIPAERLPRLLKEGYRMPKPNNCSKQLYEVMQSCWRARPRERPTFAELHAELDALLNSACADEYLSLEVDDDPPTPKPQRYVKMLLSKSNLWPRGETYERPLKAHQGSAQSNHYTSPPAQVKLT